MSDPISLVIGGAALGGAAAKIAEKAWESGERWLKERFGSYSADAREQAHENAALFVNLLAKRIAEIEREQGSIGDQLSQMKANPHIFALLEKSLINAAQTMDETKVDLLAALVAARMNSPDEETFSLASKLASDAIAQSTRNQLKLMAFLTFIDEIRPRDTYGTTDAFKMWLEVFFSFFSDLSFKEIDSKHLAAIACATYDRTSTRSLGIALAMKSGLGLITELHKDDFGDVPGVLELRAIWNEGLGGTYLTSVGSVIGGLALGQMLGTVAEPPAWA